MKKALQKWLTLVTAGMMTFSAVSGLTACGEDKNIILKNVTQAKNVILLIGDGMGPTQIKAGELFKGKKLAMQGFPYMTKVETRSLTSDVTDSAAAATALATGQRTANGIVGRDNAYEDLETIVDIAHGLGKRTGILATEELYGATPMGFSGHANARGETETLLESAANTSNVNLFASSAIAPAYQDIFMEAGYERLENSDDISACTSDKVFGSYTIDATFDKMMSEGESVAFDRLVTEALEYLSQDEDGFFLMAEGSHIDHGGHNNNICYMLEELIAFDNAVQAVLNWAKNRDDTVVIVTADHETGGLTLEEGVTHAEMVETYEEFGRSSCYSWMTSGHTGVDVNCYINGADIDFAKYSFGSKDRIQNTDVFEIMKHLLKGESAA
jgi:alkaline phosphatase